MLQEAVFVLSLSARAGELGLGLVHRVLSGQGDKNLVCKKEPARRLNLDCCGGPGSKHADVKYGEGWGAGAPPVFNHAQAPTRQLLVRLEEAILSQRQDWKVSRGLLDA